MSLHACMVYGCRSGCHCHCMIEAWIILSRWKSEREQNTQKNQSHGWRGKNTDFNYYLEFGAEANAEWLILCTRHPTRWMDTCPATGARVLQEGKNINNARVAYHFSMPGVWPNSWRPRTTAVPVISSHFEFFIIAAAAVYMGTRLRCRIGVSTVHDENCLSETFSSH